MLVLKGVTVLICIGNRLFSSPEFRPRDDDSDGLAACCATDNGPDEIGFFVVLLSILLLQHFRL